MRTDTQGLIAACAVLSLVVLTACTSSTTASSSDARVATDRPSSNGDDLQAAMDKLEESIQKPKAPFHAYFKKSGSDGFSYECEADISSSGILGQQIDNNPATKIGTDVFPANTRTRQLNGTPYGSPAWRAVYGNITMAYLNGHIRDAQPGVKYSADEQSGGYAARRYDFDLTGVDADVKKAVEMGNSFGMRQTKDYNVKGSAWISKDDGRMVKFSFDNVYTLREGKIESTHYEGALTKH